MLKTIKKNVHMRLDELIKYVRENKKTLFKNRGGITFSTKNNNEVIFYKHGELTLGNWISSVDLFEVEIEEEITEDMVFERLVEIYSSDLKTYIERHRYLSVKDILAQEYEVKTLKIYALIEDDLQLIWERDNHGTN